MDPPLCPIPHRPHEWQACTDTLTHTKICQAKCYHILLDARGLLLHTHTHTQSARFMHRHTHLMWDLCFLLSSVTEEVSKEMKMSHVDVNHQIPPFCFSLCVISGLQSTQITELSHKLQVLVSPLLFASAGGWWEKWLEKTKWKCRMICWNNCEKSQKQNGKKCWKKGKQRNKAMKCRLAVLKSLFWQCCYATKNLLWQVQKTGRWMTWVSITRQCIDKVHTQNIQNVQQKFNLM